MVNLGTNVLQKLSNLGMPSIRPLNQRAREKQEEKP